MKRNPTRLPFYLAAFIVTTTLGVVLSIGIPLFAGKQLNAGPLFLGSLGALGALVYAPFVIIFGRLIDRFNRKLVLIIGCLLFSLTYLAMTKVKYLYQIPLIYPLGNIGMAMFWPSIQSWLALGLNREQLLRSLGIFNVSWGAGWMVGPFVGGFLYEWGYSVPFIFATIFIFFAILLLARQPLILEKVRESDLNPSPTPVAEVRDNGGFLHAALVANLMSWFFIGIIRSLFPKLGTFLGMETWVIGSLVALFGLSQTAMFIILRRTHRWQYRLLPLLSFQSLGSMGLLIMLISRSAPVFSLAFVLLGISCGMTYFSSIFYSLYGHLDKGRKSGVHEAFIAAGCLLGPLIGGISAHIFGNLKAPYLITFILMVFAIAIEVRIVKSKVNIYE